MATKRPQAPNSAAAEAANALRLGLRPTDTPGVYHNSYGLQVNASGVLLSFQEVKAKDSQRFTDVLGKDATTPAEVLAALALDPRVPMLTRIECAKAAAPYTNRKQPIALDGGVDDSGTARPLFTREALEGLSDAELAAGLKVLKAAAAKSGTTL